MGRWGAVLGLGVAVAVGAAGCAGPAGGPGAPENERLPGTPEVRARWTSCAVEAPEQASPRGAGTGGNDALTLPRLGDGFVPVATVVCSQEPQRRRDGGEDLVATESRAGDVAALVAALRLADEPPTDGPCTADLPVVPWLVLLDEQGRWVRPGVPRDECGKVRVEVRQAVGALRLTRTSTRPIRQIESAEAVAAGCSQTWADMVWVEASAGHGDRSAAAGPLLEGATGRARGRHMAETCRR